jgi:hypothetical protein
MYRYIIIVLVVIIPVHSHPRTTGLETLYDGRRCQKLRFDLCREFGNGTKFPNFVGHINQEDAALEADQYVGFAESCDSPHMKEFICSVYFPVCFRDKARRPRRSLCQKSQKKCFHLMEVLGYEAWPFNCTDFPLYRRSVGTVGCERLEVSMCQGFGYTFTKLPNPFGMDNQTLIRNALWQYDYRYFERRGHYATFWRELNEFLCNAFLPRCTRGPPRTPSVATCNRLKTSSVEPMMHHYIEWPAQVDCELLRRPRIQQCKEPLRVSMCQNLGYRFTQFPNSLARTQEEASDKIRQFWPMIYMRCSPETKRFICGLYFPRCTRFGEAVPVLGSVCIRIKASCTPPLKAINPQWEWPQELNCDRFP